jgi:glucan phosphoethanolaminetransferase (alkaline phosphatase superfamily)
VVKVSPRELIALAWSQAWERLVGALPLPRGLSDFIIVLAVASLLVLLYKLNRVWLRVALILLWGVAIASVILYYVGG